MTTYLLDASVLIALTVAEHEHHARTSAWASGIDRFAVCPVVEGALVRFLVRMGESARVAQDVLRAVHALPGCEFGPDSLSYVTTSPGAGTVHPGRARARFPVPLVVSHTIFPMSATRDELIHLVEGMPDDQVDELLADARRLSSAKPRGE